MVGSLQTYFLKDLNMHLCNVILGHAGVGLVYLSGILYTLLTLCLRVT